MQINRTQIEVVRGSVLEQTADAIVNAANKGMRGGSALDGAIHRAAGPRMLEELVEIAPHGSQTAEVVVTRAYELPQKFVFHVAGPVWKTERAEDCEDELAQAYYNCLAEADVRGLESLALPSLSTGVYGFPLERAAPIALKTTIYFLHKHPETSLELVTFAMFGGPEHHEFRRALEQLSLEQLSLEQLSEAEFQLSDNGITDNGITDNGIADNGFQMSANGDGQL